MSFGWCHDERPYPDEEMEDLKAKIAELIAAGDPMAAFLEQLPGSSIREIWCEQVVQAWKEAKEAE